MYREKKMKQYHYSSDFDPSILASCTVKNIMKLFYKLVEHIAPIEKKKLSEIHQFRILNRDFNHAAKIIGKRTKQSKK